MKKITPKQKKFADFYIECGNATEAAKRAGYSEKTAYSIGQRLLKNVEVSAYIAKRQQEIESERLCTLKEIQEFRSRVMEQFRSGNFPILIATDVAARGIDVDDIDLVVNFDLPQDNEYYIHRVGRTGRAGKKGLAITLVSGGKQRGGIKDIIRYTKTNNHKLAIIPAFL